MIDTLTQSSKAYLALLEGGNGGNQSHPASKINLIPNVFEFIENKAWPVITCKLPPKLKFSPDSGATLVPSNHPGRAIPIQILEYDPPSGFAKIALEENPQDSTGQLVIDFKWLIIRLIQWLEKHGTNVGNPFQLAGHARAQTEFSNVGAMSDEQIASVKNLLGNAVAYVWGPPGTGKTRHVLAETVAHLTRRWSRVLVTAATNLAVDNALDAILRVDGVEQKDVLRIGYPTDEFRDQWPESCESKAFDAEMEKLQGRLKFLRDLLAATQQRTELTQQLSDLSAEVLETESALNLVEREIAQLSEEFDRITAELSQLDLLCEDSQQQLDQAKQTYNALALADKAMEISVLEHEQTTLMGERQKAEAKIADLRWWEKCFTKRKEQLNQCRNSASKRLESVETTLHNKRTSYLQASQEGQNLQSTIAELEAQFATQKKNRRAQATKLRGLALHRTTKEEHFVAVGKRNYEAKGTITSIQEELRQIEGMASLPTDQSQIDALVAESIRVQNSMAKIHQDLSDKLVLGMTLDTFVGLTMNESLHFDHVIVDEAGYAPLAKVIPLCSLHCPISLLGDHYQLPPVYQGKNHVQSKCYWGTSALYLEDAFDSGIGTSPVALLARSKCPPRFQKLSHSKLTRSYRFGAALADLIDRHFYEMGLSSLSTAPTSIEVIDCPIVIISQWKPRENHGECSAVIARVGSWLNWNANHKGTLAVLSPYTNQVKLLEAALWNSFSQHPDYDLLDVLTIHKAQGREWDTVFFSASDTGRLQGNSPWFSDTSKPEGKLVVNTAISRAKKHLRIFCDKWFWANRLTPDSLLSELSR